MSERYHSKHFRSTAAATMKVPTDPPSGLVPVPLGTACLVLLTEREYLAGIGRGKWWWRLAGGAAMPEA